MSHAIDPRDFRRALGNFACGVTVVTATGKNGHKVGVTANSFNSVSLEPPLILWSLDKRSSAWETFQSAGHFTVNLLSSDQIALSNQFARPSDDKFAGVRFTHGFDGAPVLDGCSANFQCSLYEYVDAGDHWILIGKVEAYEDLGTAPLLYHQGSYSMVLPHPQAAPTSESSVPCPNLLDTKLSDNIFYLMIQAVDACHPLFVQEHEKLGLRNGESRLMMVLDSAPHVRLDLSTLQRAVSMPATEVEETIRTLQSKGFIHDLEVTTKGHRKLEELWQVVQAAQDKILTSLTENETAVFKKALKAVIAAQ